MTRLIAEARTGDEAALSKLHQRYWPVLVQCARKRLRGAPLRYADEEDVAQHACISFFQALKAGGHAALADRHDLLALLTTIVACKAVNQIKEATRAKRDQRRVSPLELLAEDDGTNPEQEAILRDCYDFYLQRLPDQLRQIAQWHLGGFKNKEIAQQLDCSEKTVERKLKLLRKAWQRILAESLDQDAATLLTQAS